MANFWEEFTIFIFIITGWIVLNAKAYVSFL